jgi:hypothetical protein
MADDVSDALGGLLPSIDKGTIGTFFITIGIAIFLVIIAGIIIYFAIMYYKFRLKIVVFKRVNNSIIPVARDRGMFQRVGMAGDSWIITKKLKKILPRTSMLMGKDEYWFFSRTGDSEWIPFTLEDIDAKFNKANIKYIDEDMRLQRLGIQKNLMNRLMKKNFWEQYGTTIMTVLFVVIVMVCLVVMFSKFVVVAEALDKVSANVGEMAKAVHNMATKTGGGTIPA